jgi:hypothetical protein
MLARANGIILLIKQKMRLGIAVTEKSNESASNG